MAMSVIIHLVGEDAILGDIEDLPNPTHTYMMLRNIRKKDGKPLPFLTDGATSFLYPWSRITFVETLGEVPGSEGIQKNGDPGTTILGFFREDEKRR